jgi:hypothetical protein
MTGLQHHLSTDSFRKQAPSNGTVETDRDWHKESMAQKQGMGKDGGYGEDSDR